MLWNYEPVLKYGSGVELDTHLGLGYDHDLEKRLSYGVQLRYALESGSFVLTYHSAFHFSDNDNGSFYLGPIVTFGGSGRWRMRWLYLWACAWECAVV
ncbi:MAG: hypothetical protein IPI72_10650 [Flavobacteriales bacterium]|nr:hypothetical protein [Flavobacteriales bacterium]